MLPKFKNYIPRSLKLIPWFLLRSPQRALGFYITYRTDLSGFLTFFTNFLQRRFKAKKLKPISICTGLKNRSDNYLKYVLPSVLQMENQDLIELSIFDCNSTDIPELETEIRKCWKGKLVFTSEEHPFERAYTFNKAIAQTTNELFFATDADMVLPKDLVSKCNVFVSKKSVWFPVCFNLRKDKPAVVDDENGYWRVSGLGMFAAQKWQFNRIGKYDEKFKSWGEEDFDLWRRFYINGFLPIRNRCIGLFHNYHPDLFEIDPRDKKMGIGK